MQNPTSLKQLIQSLMPKQDDIIIGFVVSENPLIIQAENDEKLKLSSANTIISKTISDMHLRLGERVHILTFCNGKKYYVLDRAG